MSDASAGSAPTAGAEPVGVGWALKQACYDAWQRDPQTSRDAAARLGVLAAAHPADRTLAALAAWTAGIGALTEGRLADALAALQRAQAGFEALADGAHAAQTRVPQIAILGMVGRDDDALECAESARAQAIAAGDDRTAARVESNLGTLLARQDRHAEAEPHFRHAALRLARVGDLTPSIVADLALAGALAWQFRFDEALQTYERARLRAQRHALPLLVSHASQGLGQIALHRGQLHEALPALAEAAALAAEHDAPPQRRLEVESTLADAYLAANLLDEALALYDALIAQAQALAAPAEQGWATLQRARALGRLGAHEAALAGFDAAIALYERAGNAVVPGLALLGRGRVELALGQARAAAASAAQARARLAPSGIVGWMLDARLLEAAAAAAGEAAAAGPLYAALLAEAEAPPGLPHVAWQAEAGLGALAADAGDRAAARQAFDRALVRLERLQAALPGDEWRRAAAVDAEISHNALVELALADGDPARLLREIERGRARALALAMADPPTHAGAPAAAGSGATRLQWLRRQWEQAVAEGDEARGPVLAGRVQELERELLDAQRRSALRSKTRPLDGAMPAFDDDALAALATALGAERALVAFHRAGDRLAAVVVDADGLRHAQWPAPGLDAALQGLRFQLDALRAGRALAERHGPLLLARAKARLQALHALVWAPLAPLIGDRTRLVVLPHRTLHYLPLAALHDGARWLVQSHELTLAPSATVWLALQRRPAPRFASALSLGVGGDALPYAAAEARAVAAAFGGTGRALCEAEATRDALRSGARTGVDLLHLACHGSFRADNPAFSHLQLADGRLTLHEIAALELPVGLAVLSACETGAARLAAGDELLGLVRAFLLAGAGAVLASRWPVDDAATATLAGRLAGALAAGQPPAAALRQAQASLADEGLHPFYWAAFALHGRG